MILCLISPNLIQTPATRLIRKHHDPNIRNVLVIAMTASAIAGDRERCLESGMNNYLAKPVRAQTLKALLESYLSKPDGEETMPILQTEAQRMVNVALLESAKENVSNTAPENNGNVVQEKVAANGVGHNNKDLQIRSRPSSVRTNTTKRWHPPEKDANGNGNETSQSPG